MTGGDKFFNEVKEVVREEGLIIEDVRKPIRGAVKEIKSPKHFATYTRDGQHILIKTIHQEVSGSASDKVVAFYVNMSEAPYDRIIIVLNDRLLNAFQPYLDYFQRRHWTLDKVVVISIEQLREYLRR